MLNLLFGSPLPRRAAESHGGGWIPSVGGARRTLAGTRIDEDSALTISAVMSATRCLMEPIAGLPLHTYRRTDDDGRAKADDHPVFDLLDVAPNPDMDAVAFREGRTGHQINWGGGFAEIEFAPRGERKAALWPIHPARVRPTWSTDPDDAAEFPYLVRNNDSTWTKMRRREILHVPGIFSEDGTWAKGVIAYARETLGGVMAVKRHGYAFFGSGGQPKAILTVPGMKDREARRQFRQEWKEVHGSPDSAEIAILPPEAKHTQISLSNEDSQFILTNVMGVKDVARFYRVPLHMLAEPELAAARASVEAQGIEFVIYSLMSWLRKWESQLNLKMLTPAERQSGLFIEHNVAALQRGDFKARMDAYRVAIMIGLLTINECRRLENYPTIGPAGDVNYVMTNMTTADRMLEGPPDPAPVGGKGGGPPFGGDGGGLPDDGTVPDGEGVAAGGFDGWTRRSLERLRLRAAGKKLRRQSRTWADQAGALAAARGVVEDVLRRVFAKEANAAERAAQKGGDFHGWSDEFYGRHESLVAAALAPAALLLTTLGRPCDAPALARRLAAESRAELKSAYDTETPSRFAERLADWRADRAGREAGAVVGGQHAGDGKDRVK